MVEIISTTVTQTRIFGPDEIPFVQLQLSQSSELIQKQFAFANPGPMLPFEAPQVPTFQGGFMEVNGKDVVITQLRIEPQRIILVVAGSSISANMIYGRLAELLKKIDSREGKSGLVERLLSEETSTVVRLAFPITRMVREGAWEKFSSGLSERIESHGATVVSTPFSFRFRIRFTELPEKLSSHGIQLSNKSVVIEMRTQTSPEDCTFFVSSPNSTDAHKALLDFLEKSFS